MKQSSTFFDLPLSEGMKQTINLIGYTSPTAIQEKSIPEILLGKDLLGQAQTGTGKTASFAIPLVEMVNDQDSTIQALVVCPTRELCLQICQEIKRLSQHKPDLKTVALYGGQSIDQQFRTLKFDLPQIVVATPGRLFDHLRRKSVALSQVAMIVLDEADEMLDMGFRPEIEEIFGLLPDENQRIFFSATMPKAIKDLACSFLREPVIVKTESKTLTVATIEQSFLKVRGREKTELLCRIIEHRNPKLAVVFCNAKSSADEIVDDMIARGFEAGVLHGDLSQNQRDRVMAKFKMGSVRFLVATDVAARGLDIDDVEMVVNYHLPHDPEDYVHRIGRTGRAGRKGLAISLVEPRDNSRLRRISLFAKTDIREQQPPTFSDIKKAKIDGFFAQVKDALASERVLEYRAIIAKQQLLPEDIAAALLQMAMKRVDERPQNDIVFAELSDRKYSGGGAERRFRDNKGRGRRSDSERGESRGRRPDFERSESRGRRPDFERSESRGRRPDFERSESRGPGFRTGGFSERKSGRSELVLHKSERPNERAPQKHRRGREEFNQGMAAKIGTDRRPVGERPSRDNDARRPHSNQGRREFGAKEQGDRRGSNNRHKDSGAWMESKKPAAGRGKRK